MLLDKDRVVHQKATIGRHTARSMEDLAVVTTMAETTPTMSATTSGDPLMDCKAHRVA